VTSHDGVVVSQATVLRIMRRRDLNVHLGLADPAVPIFPNPEVLPTP
jgi:hypothetical protein